MLLWTMFIRTVKQTTRNSGRIALIVIMPIAFLGVFAFIFGDFGAGSTVNLTIGVVNYDAATSISTWDSEFGSYLSLDNDESINPLETGFGEFFLKSLEGKTTVTVTDTSFRIIEFDSPSSAIPEVKSRAIVAILTIPTDFSLAILSGINTKQKIINGSYLVDDPSITNKNATVSLYGDPSYISFNTARVEIEKAFSKFRGHFYDLNLPAGHFNADYQSISTFKLSQFDYFTIGFFTLGLLLSGSAVAGILGDEREEKTLDRLKLSRMTSKELLLGITLNQLVIGGIQLVILFVSAYAFGFKAPGNPLYAFVVSYLVLIPVLGIAFFVTAIVPNGKDASGVVSVLSAPLYFVSGTFLPLPKLTVIKAIIPNGIGGFRDFELWDLFPLKSSATAMEKIFLYNYTLEQVLPEIVLLLVTGIGFFIIGMIVFFKRILEAEN